MEGNVDAVVEALRVEKKGCETSLSSRKSYGYRNAGKVIQQSWPRLLIEWLLLAFLLLTCVAFRMVIVMDKSIVD